ncbi:MAG: DUF3071 domain-containing protein [Nocardioides sp.]|nr:DUF3071 domain-containing protein [Nocardioides sp.]
MAQLTFTGRSEDDKRLLLVDESGREFTLVLDARLRSALMGMLERKGPHHSGQLEIPMESTLRPRDIQTRIRAGETPEAVAHAAGTSVEKIMAFAGPVMAERAHIAQRAQLSTVRRRSGESGARTLGEAVAAHLRDENVLPGVVEWDAWRREDGRWTLTGSYDVSGRSGHATFSYDPRGSFVTVDDEDARWLIGDTTPTAEMSGTIAEPTSDDLSAARQRRLTSVSPDELPLGEDAIEMVAGEDEDIHSPAETTLDFGETSLGTERSAETYLDVETEPPSRPAPDESETADAPAADTTDEAPAPKPPKKRGRASVPSWDEIMFGGGKVD